MTKEKILVTSALPYANGPIHFGHIAGAYLPADCYVRFERLQKNDILYICGSDEYGVAITMSAEMAGRTPREHVDINHELIKSLFQKLNISFDHYSRTTWEGHIKPVQQYFLDLLNNGFIEVRETDQLYSEEEKRFLADRYVTGTCPACGFENARGDECPKCGASYEATDLKKPRSKLSGSPLTLRKTKHWFLMLDKFRDKLTNWLETKNWKPNVVNFVKGYIEGLRPRAITRDSQWGVPIPLPNTEGKVLYVWFDAPIGYISATQEWAQKKGSPESWKEYWCDPQTKLVNFIGKDNIPFHAAIFPAMTMGQNQPFKLVDELPANEFYMLEGRQFSKSDGWYVDLAEFLTKYTADQIRYAIAANAPETSDSEFTWKDFQLRSNSDLLGKYGNLVNRVLVFAKNNCEGIAPSKGKLQSEDELFLSEIKRLVKQAAEFYATFRLRQAAQTVMELAQLGNVYFDAKKPWAAAKQPETRSSMETTIANCLVCLKALALISYPIIPETASKLWQQLGFTEPLTNQSWSEIAESEIPAGHKLGQPKVLFQRIEDEQIEQELKKMNEMFQQSHTEPQAEATPVYEPLKPEITIEDFSKIDLRVGTILNAEAVAKSKKLIKVEVDLGFEKRTVVSGIRLHYEPSELIGKKVILVANLKPTAIMGINSFGMVLAGKNGEMLKLATVPSELGNGSTVA